ncbi:MAG: DUF3618 domain-containing protein [Austwickia sp.]|nr:DUF3618 domain-containing protein [Austwickia sp.]MBK8434969.1 DUF3618 domain-containing protein [Austwickia sp.]MBK9101473.1 DUF3618 domain-containing protein [Austwickia sp.]
MSQDPDQIRAEIERTRAELSRNVDALTESVKPGNVARRQGQKLTDAVMGVKERVMGSDDLAGDAGTQRIAELQEAAGQRVAGIQDAAGQRLADAHLAVSNAPAAARRQTQGNPLAAGLIALGAGWLIGSLLPSSQRERELSVELADRAAPLTEEVTAMAKNAGQTLRPGIEEAVASVREAATGAAEQVSSQGKDVADQLAASAQGAREQVKASAVEASQTVRNS